jgi:hypothetical protein
MKEQNSKLAYSISELSEMSSVGRSFLYEEITWGLDNNLTRKVSLADPLQIAMLKGLIAGPINLILGLVISLAAPTLSRVLLAGIVGFLGYGISLALFVVCPTRPRNSAHRCVFFHGAFHWQRGSGHRLG